MVATQEDVKDRRPLDAMDIDRNPSDVEEVLDAEDDESEEAPNERDTDAESNGESPQTSHHSDDDAPICQTPLEEHPSTPCHLGVSPLRAKLFDFATPSQASNRHPHLVRDVGAREDDADEERDGDDEDQTDEEGHGRDEVYEDQDEEDHKDQDEDHDVQEEEVGNVDVVLESSHSDPDTYQPPQPVPRSPLRPTTADVPRVTMDIPRSPLKPHYFRCCS